VCWRPGAPREPGQGAAAFCGTHPAPAGTVIRGKVVTGKIYDIEGVLNDYSTARVRLTSLRPGVSRRPRHPRGERANLPAQPGRRRRDIDEGDLPKICPELYKQRRFSPSVPNSGLSRHVTERARWRPAT
jgi:hypothetical protein